MGTDREPSIHIRLTSSSPSSSWKVIIEPGSSKGAFKSTHQSNIPKKTSQMKATKNCMKRKSNAVLRILQKNDLTLENKCDFRFALSDLGCCTF